MREVAVGLRGDLARDEDRAEHRHAVEEEPELGGDVGGTRKDDERAEREAGAVTGAAGRRRPVGRTREEAQHEHQDDACSREGVRPLHVQVGLVDDAGPGNGGAEQERQERDRPGPAAVQPLDDEPEDRDRRQRGREAEKDDDAACGAVEAGQADVVGVPRRHAPVGGEDRGPVGRNQQPDRENLR